MFVMVVKGKEEEDCAVYIVHFLQPPLSLNGDSSLADAKEGASMLVLLHYVYVYVTSFLSSTLRE